MFTFDLADALRGAKVTVNAIHPATFMATKMVVEAGLRPLNTVETGADAVLHLVTSADVEQTTGAFFNVMQETRANPAAYDAAARERLRTLTSALTGVSLA
jgi:NAD(P)-dependent dehydrogenase (short-subunit alcohol dehydrogenase family)